MGSITKIKKTVRYFLKIRQKFLVCLKTSSEELTIKSSMVPNFCWASFRLHGSTCCDCLLPPRFLYTNLWPSGPKRFIWISSDICTPGFTFFLRTPMSMSGVSSLRALQDQHLAVFVKQFLRIFSICQCVEGCGLFLLHFGIHRFLYPLQIPDLGLG